MSVEQRTVHRRVPVFRAVSVKQQVDKVVAFSVQRREKIDEDAQRGSADEELDVRIGIFAEDVFQRVHRAGEIKRYQSAEDAQKDVGRYFVYGESVLQVEFKNSVRTRYGECHSGGRHA